MVNTHHEAGSVQKAIKGLTQGESFPVHISHEKERLLGGGGTLGANKTFLEKGGGSFAVANGDSVALMPPEILLQMKDFHEKHKASVTLLTTKHISKFKPLYEDADQRLHLKPQQGRPIHFVGYMFLSPEVFEIIPEGEVYHLFNPDFLTKMKVMSFYREDLTWFETGDKDSYLYTTKMLMQDLNGKNSKVQALFDELAHEGDLLKGPHGMIFKDQDLSPQLINQSKGFCTFGKGCEVSLGSTFENCCVMEGAKVKGPTNYKNELVF